MNVMPKQARRAASLATPLGEDILSIVRFDGSEGVCELFEWRVEAISAQSDIDFDALIGKNATVTIKSIGGAERKYDGIVTEAQWLGARDHFFAYRLVLRPWLYLLSHRTDCFIFHDKPVTAIISDVFGRHGFANFEDRTTKSFPPIEYCVQYRESDMAFVMRLMEQYGISWFHLHEDGSHKLVLVDANAHFEAAEKSSRRYIPLAGQDRRTEESFHHFSPERRFTSGKTLFRDYNFKTPSARMDADYSGSASYENAGLELYDWPGNYDKQGDGKPLATVKLQAEEGLDRRCLAAGNCVTLFAGCLVSMEEYPADAYNTEYIVLRAQHSFVSQSYRSGVGIEGEDSYDGQFELLKSEIPFQPAPVTPRPFVHGPQTAVVVGAQGEEIDCDEWGRILVRFHWDRKNDQSMRCRVAQIWASQQWGGMVIPRVGMEVVVEFLEGDPDRPLVTGCVYNGNNKPPYTLPRFKTRATWRSKSHKGSGFNEIRFEDEAGEEEIYVHAEKFLNTDIGNNETRNVGANRHVAVGGSNSESIGNHKDMDVGGNHRETVAGHHDFSLGKSRTVSIGEAEHITVGADRVLAVGASADTEIGGNFRVSVGGAQSNTVGTTWLLNAGTTVVIESMAISLNSGGNFVKIDPSGVQIQGTTVLINSGGAPAKLVALVKKVIKAVKKYAGPHAEKYPRSSQK